MTAYQGCWGQLKSQVGDDARPLRNRLPCHLVRGELAGAVDVPVSGEHRQRVAGHRDGDLVLPGKIGSGQAGPVLLLAGHDLVGETRASLTYWGE